MKTVLECICFGSLFFTIQSIVIFQLTYASHQYIMFTVVGALITSIACLFLVKLEQLEKLQNEDVYN